MKIREVKLDHPTDPRYLVIEGELPECISVDDLGSWRYGRPLVLSTDPLGVIVYAQPDGFGTDWVRPEAWS